MATIIWQIIFALLNDILRILSFSGMNVHFDYMSYSTSQYCTFMPEITFYHI